MSDNVLNTTDRILREIQRDLADMRDDSIVTQARLDRLEAALSSQTVGMSSISVEQRALRSQFDRFRTETREALARIEKLLTKKD